MKDAQFLISICISLSLNINYVLCDLPEGVYCTVEGKQQQLVVIMADVQNCCFIYFFPTLPWTEQS